MSQKSLIKTRFDRAASSYDTHAWLQLEIAQRLTEKLTLLKHPPKKILDIGQGTGALCKILQNYYKNTPELFGVDISYAMCKQATLNFRPSGWFSVAHFKKKSRPKFIQADGHQLPFLAEQFQLLASNCVLQWCDDLPRLFRECHRVLAIQGNVFFSSFGPDSLQELKACSQKISGRTHVHDFVDMHVLGDILLSCHFTDPIMDMEKITTYYPTLQSLLLDLKKIGATNQHADRHKGLMGKNWFKKLELEYEKLRSPQGLPVTWEVVYGHATKTAPLPTTWQDPEGKIFTSVRRI
jgi:malonyl-CoA O-methyltransferase